jgi:hypothetical protein
MTIDDDPQDDGNDDPEDTDSQNDDTTDDREDNDTSRHFVSTSAIAPTSSALAAMFTDVTRQLNSRTDDDMNERRALIDDDGALARIDAHVRAILASADPMLYALNTTLGHEMPRTSPPPLTDETIASEIADMYAHYYADTSSSEYESLFPYAGRPPPSVADPPRTQPSQLALKHTLMQDILDRRSPRTQPYVTTSTPHSDLDIRFEVIPQAMEGSETTPNEPPHNRETALGSSSAETPLPTLRPRASWMIDDGDDRTEAQADADWHRANEWLRTPPAPPLRNPNGFRRPSISPHTRMGPPWRRDRSQPQLCTHHRPLATFPMGRRRSPTWSRTRTNRLGITAPQGLSLPNLQRLPPGQGPSPAILRSARFLL